MKENVNKQLSLSQRTRIEEMLNQRKRKYKKDRKRRGLHNSSTFEIRFL